MLWLRPLHSSQGQNRKNSSLLSPSRDPARRGLLMYARDGQESRSSSPAQPERSTQAAPCCSCSFSQAGKVLEVLFGFGEG